MTTGQPEHLIEEIKQLSELDLDTLLREIARHLRKQNLEHLIDNAFQIDDLAEAIDELEDKCRALRSERDEMKSTLNKIKEIL